MSSRICALCDETSSSISFCSACNFNLCNECWVTYPAHRKGLLGPQGLPHDKVDPNVVDDLKVCLEEPSEETEYRLHQEDEETTWFGLERDVGGEPVLAEYRRYAAIMMQASQRQSRAQYPSLVSFIGQTGAGKSSLINLLIGLNAGSGSEDLTLTTPVIGRSSSVTPTSADVHLYLSPHDQTSKSKQVILYADCEGFNGGERNPVAVNATIPDVRSQPASHTANRQKQKIVQKVSQGTKRLLKWASHDSSTYEKASKRSYTVSEMYPRIFYAFSDVIVFVLDNPKTLEVVVEHLLDWAHANYSKAINQPMKPHAIIALNKSNNSTPEAQWDSLSATAHLLSTTNAKIDENPTFVRYAKLWQDISFTRIDSMNDLLRCYYSTVHVVRLPEKSRYQLLDSQRGQLRNIIQDCCAISYRDKQDRELLTDLDEFGVYLSLAFDHFSETLDEPFDFVEASLKKSPLSDSFHDNLLIFAKRYALHVNLTGQIRPLFQSFTAFVASCILLDSVRKQRIGKPENWFGELVPTENEEVHWARYHRRSSAAVKPITGTYREACRKAINKYMDYHVPCAFTLKDLTNQRQCDTRKAHHQSTHRIKTTLRTIDRAGYFASDVDEAALNNWEEEVLKQIISTQDKLKHLNISAFRQAVIESHAEVVQQTYSATGGAAPSDFQLNCLCVACLYNPPQHALPCGHIICTECARDFGNDLGRIIEVQTCPLCARQRKSSAEQATSIEILPAFSGLRVLTLDGGGIRGIVELCILQAVEKCLGMPIQKCFDLIVGTSTGGIIALGLGHEMWPINTSMDKFRSLVNDVFTLRKGQDMHVIRRIQLFVKHSKYETKPLEAAFKETFGHKKLLFPQPISSQKLRTAVVAVSSSGSKTWLFSNYNTLPRSGSEQLEYRRYRPDRQKREVYTWEAARATSAAPGFFKPFTLTRPESEHLEFIDGGVLHNNPVELAIEEVRRVASTECLNHTPDIVLSVGTGLSKRLRTKGEMLSEEKWKDPPTVRTGWIRNLFTMVSYQIKLNTDTDRRWARIVEANRDMDNSKKLYRINPDLGREPPELDNVDEVANLATDVPKLLASKEYQASIKEVASVLVASSFYFERGEAPIFPTNTGAELRGRICCRLKDGDKHITSLAKFIRQAHAPDFIIYNDSINSDDQLLTVPLTEMAGQGRFPDIEVKIFVTGDDTLTTIALRLPRFCERLKFPISGFPRKMMRTDYGQHATKSSRTLNASNAVVRAELPG